MKFFIVAPLLFMSAFSQFDAITHIARDAGSFISNEANNVKNIATNA